ELGRRLLEELLGHDAAHLVRRVVAQELAYHAESEVVRRKPRHEHDPSVTGRHSFLRLLSRRLVDGWASEARAEREVSFAYLSPGPGEVAVVVDHVVGDLDLLGERKLRVDACLGFRSGEAVALHQPRELRVTA